MKMAILRLCTTSTTRIARVIIFNNLQCQSRQNHFLVSKRVIKFFHPTTPKIIDNRKIPAFRLCAVLEHTLSASNPSVIQTVDSGAQTIKTNVTNNAPVNVNTDVQVSNAVDIGSLPPVPSPEITPFLGEPTLESLGLATWSPAGLIRQILELCHASLGLPWWGSIVALTALLRIMMFPLSVYMKRDTIRYQNVMPELQHLQNKLTEARRSGNYFESTRVHVLVLCPVGLMVALDIIVGLSLLNTYITIIMLNKEKSLIKWKTNKLMTAMCAQEVSNFVSTKKIFGAGMIIPYVVQFPVFLSVFIALRSMANTPELTSFQNGGLYWFKDLSVYDQYYILPLLTSVTLWATIKTGSDFVVPMKQSSSFNIQSIMTVGIPVITFICTMKFSAAILCYWVTSNIYGLLQTLVLKIEPIRKYLNIPLLVKSDYNKEKKTKGKKGFVEDFKDSYRNMSISHEIKERDRLNAMKFEEAGRAPVQRTFKHDPTKPRPMTVLGKSKVTGGK